LGTKTPKFINACKSLAGCGYKVIAVQMDSMQNLLIDTFVIDEVVKIIESVASNYEICPKGKLSIFAASFAGGISLAASSDERIAGKVTSICLIGSFSDIESSVNYLMISQESDNYGRLIILKNFLKYSFDVPEKIYKAFDIALADNFFKREKPELPAYLRTLSMNNYDIIIRLLYDPYFRLYHWNRIKKDRRIEVMIERFSTDKYLNKINASVLIIHGIYDNVIPPLESIRLYNKLQKIKVNSKLILTPLMNHSDLKFNFNIMPLVIDLFNGLSFYFNAV
jgi:cephalosporin-C deacetylase-like acetyl esterase